MSSDLEFLWTPPRTVFVGLYSCVAEKWEEEEKDSPDIVKLGRAWRLPGRIGYMPKTRSLSSPST